MMGKTHYLFGCLCMTVLGPPILALSGSSLSPLELSAGIIVAGIAGLLPDIDHPGAFLSQGKLPIPLPRPLKKLGGLLGFLLSLPPRVLGFFVRGVTGHRKGTHSLLLLIFWTIAALPLYMLFFGFGAWLLAIPLGMFGSSFDPSLVWQWQLETWLPAMPIAMVIVGIGYFSHLFSDSLNTATVPWLWPLDRKGVHFLPKPLRIPVQSTREDMFKLWTVAVLALSILFVIVKPAAQLIDNGHSIVDTIIYSAEELESGENKKEKTKEKAEPKKKSDNRSNNNHNKIPPPILP